MSAHTPGPWTQDGGSVLAPCQFQNSKGEPQTMTVADCNYCFSMEDPEANARLIAAAPELLEALKSLVARCEMNFRFPDLLPAARKAIERAEGSK